MRLLALLLILMADNWVGTWNMDPARSSYNPGPIPQRVILKYESIDGGVKVTNDTVDAEGKSVVRTTTLKFDGRDYPYSNNINADTASGKRIDDYSFETIWKKGGSPTLSHKISVSPDLKTLTVIQSGKDAQGRTVRNVSVYSRSQ